MKAAGRVGMIIVSRGGNDFCDGERCHISRKYKYMFHSLVVAHILS